MTMQLTDHAKAASMMLINLTNAEKCVRILSQSGAVVNSVNADNYGITTVKINRPPKSLRTRGEFVITKCGDEGKRDYYRADLVECRVEWTEQGGV